MVVITIIKVILGVKFGNKSHNFVVLFIILREWILVKKSNQPKKLPKSQWTAIVVVEQKADELVLGYKQLKDVTKDDIVLMEVGTTIDDVQVLDTYKEILELTYLLNVLGKDLKD